MSPTAPASAAARIPREDFQYLQALEDAMCYRVARAAAPCASCDAAAPARCDDHGRDAELIGEYDAAAERCAARIQAATRGSASSPS